jgi:4-oxalocrotonate tautomerase
MPYVNVRVLEGVSAEQKVRVIERITQVLVEELGKNPASTFVVIDEVPNDNWGHYGTSITRLRAKAAAEAKAPPKKAAAKKAAARVQKAPAKKGAVRKA